MAIRGSNLLLSIFLFVATFFFLHPATIATGDVALTPALAPEGSNNNAIAFIRLSCRVTRYPDVCYSTLRRYANTINEDPTELARVALTLSVNKGRSLASHMAKLAKDGANSNDISALLGCSSSLGDLVKEIRDSVKQIRRINGAGNQANLFSLQISNVQMYMNSELTIVDSCTNGLEGIKDGEVKTDIKNQVKEFKKLTGNALAIVNSYANQVKS